MPPTGLETANPTIKPLQAKLQHDGGQILYILRDFQIHFDADNE
jgi:hypothetical protein